MPRALQSSSRQPVPTVHERPVTGSSILRHKLQLGAWCELPEDIRRVTPYEDYEKRQAAIAEVIARSILKGKKRD
jgi:hypothetical protein